MTLLDLLLIALAAWRFAYFIVREDGPGNVMGWLRHQLVPEGTKPKPGSLGAAFTCIKCMSVWGAGLAYSLSLTPLGMIFLMIAAGSAAAIMVSEWIGVNYQASE